MARRLTRHTTPSLVAAALLAALVLTALGVAPSGTAPAAAAERTSTTVEDVGGTTAHVRLSVVTTSDWAVVRFPTGRLLGTRVVQSSGDVDVLADGVRVRGEAGRYQGIVVEALLEVLPTVDPALELTRGHVGSTRARIEVLDEALPAVQFDHTTTVEGDPENRQRETIDRARLFGAQPVPTMHGDDRRLVLAFYYPWFSDYEDSRFTDRPADPRPTDVQSSVDDITAQAAANGVDGFIVSWAGQDRNGLGFDLAQRAAAANDQVVAGYFETQVLRELAGSDAGAQARLARQWLDDLLLRARPWYRTYLRDGDGVPVVFAYRTADISPQVWQTVLDDLAAAGTPVRLIGDAADPAYAEAQGGLHSYSALGSEDQRRVVAHRYANQSRADAVVSGSAADIVVGSVAPGYDDTLVRDGTVVERGKHGERYLETWRAALSADPDWVAVTTWNEWFEGTSIEPSQEHGGRALSQTAWLSSEFSGTPVESAPSSLEKTRGKGAVRNR